MSEAFIRSGNPYFKAHGVSVEDELITQKADILYPPALKYNKEGTDPDLKTAGWRLGHKTCFMQPAEVKRMVAVLIRNEIEDLRVV